VEIRMKILLALCAAITVAGCAGMAGGSGASGDDAAGGHIGHYSNPPPPGEFNRSLYVGGG